MKIQIGYLIQITISNDTLPLVDYDFLKTLCNLIFTCCRASHHYLCNSKNNETQTEKFKKPTKTPSTLAEKILDPKLIRNQKY